MSDSDLHLLTGAYAADALSPQERRDFELHLPTCPSCAQEVRELQATTAVLGAASATTPPPSLKQSVLDEARSTPQAAPLEAARTRRLERLVPLLGAVAAVLALLVLGLGSWAVALHRQTDQALAQASGVTEVLTAPDAALSSSAIAGGGRGTVVVSPALRSAVFVASQLAPTASGRTYQLWWIDPSGGARSAGLVSPASDGSVASSLAGAPSGASHVGLTVEPAGGSSAPTTKPVFVVTIPV